MSRLVTVLLWALMAATAALAALTWAMLASIYKILEIGFSQ